MISFDVCFFRLCIASLKPYSSMLCVLGSMVVWVLQNSQVRVPVMGENLCGAPQEVHVKFRAEKRID